jgi:hypothetical protein
MSRNASVKRHSNAGDLNIKPKTKLLTVIERKITNVPHAEFLRKRDVTLEEKKTIKIYTALNLCAFLFQIVAIALVQYFKNFDTNFWTPTDTPVSVSKTIFLIELSLISGLEILFVIMPLPCMRCFGARQHF